MVEIMEILVSEESRYNFLKGLVYVAKCDEVNDEERNFFNNAAISLGLSDDYIKNINKLWITDGHEEICFDNKKEALFFIREAIQLCAIDGKYSNKEKDTIEKLVEGFGINNDSLRTIEQWVEDGIRWKIRGDDLLGLEV